MNNDLLSFSPNSIRILYIITENGGGDFDAVVEPDRGHDEHRIQYIMHYLTQLEKAIDAGSDMRGYFM